MADLERANERAAQAERQTERLKQQLAVAAQGLESGTGAGAGPGGSALGPDGTAASTGGSDGGSTATDQAMDILKRSTLEVELAAKEKEVSVHGPSFRAGGSSVFEIHVGGFQPFLSHFQYRRSLRRLGDVKLYQTTLLAHLYQPLISPFFF